MSECHPAWVNRIAIANLEKLLTQQYNQDFAEQHYEQKEMSVEDKKFMNIVSDSAVLKDGHYYLKLPFSRARCDHAQQQAYGTVKSTTAAEKVPTRQNFPGGIPSIYAGCSGKRIC